MPILKKTLIEVYSTNIYCTRQAEQLEASIISEFPHVKVSYDLQDCDKILKVSGDFDPSAIVEIAKHAGLFAQLLED